MLGARRAATPQPGLLDDTVHDAKEEISFRPGGGGGGAVGRSTCAFGSGGDISALFFLFSMFSKRCVWRIEKTSNE